MQSKINVVIVDDQRLIRQGIKSLFESHEHIAVVHEAANGLEIINWFRDKPTDLKVDVVLMDMQMPEMDGWETTAILVRTYNDLKIIGLSSYDNAVFIDRLIQNGGRGYLLKDQEIEEVVNAIEQVIDIGYYFSERVSLEKITNFINSKQLIPTFDTTDLTDREKRIVQLICAEHTNQEIADELFISRKTVESHRERIMNKIKARNMIGIAMYALKHNLVDFRV
jgi:DNA-binding NarL/FixJ family response regulator